MTGLASRERCPNVTSDGASMWAGAARQEVPFWRVAPPNLVVVMA